MEFISSSKPTARKEHKCDYCFGRIKVGEKYVKSCIKGDSIYTWKSHLSCDKLVCTLFIKGDRDGITSDDFQEYVKEKYDSLMIDIYSDGNHPMESFKEKLEFVKLKSLRNDTNKIED